MVISECKDLFEGIALGDYNKACLNGALLSLYVLP